MKPDEFALLAQYGWLAFLAIYILRDILPGLIKWYQRRVDKTDEHTIDQAEAAAAFERANVARQIKAMERIADSTEGQRAILEGVRSILDTINNRLAHLEDTAAATRTGVAVLLDRKTNPRGQKPVSHLPSPTKPRSDPPQ
jgi:hypothetical protein